MGVIKSQLRGLLIPLTPLSYPFAQVNDAFVARAPVRIIPALPPLIQSQVERWRVSGNDHRYSWFRIDLLQMRTTDF